MKLAVISMGNPRDKKYWSGTPYSIVKQLEKYYEIVYIQPKESSIIVLLLKIIKFFHKYVFNKNYNYVFTKAYAKMMSRKTKRMLDEVDVDMLFFIAGSTNISYLETKHPIVYLTDAVFGSMVDYYEQYSNLTSKNIESGNTIELKALEKAKTIIVSSDWCKKEAINLYQIESEKITMVPFGANLHKSELNDLIGPTSNRVKENSAVNILFIGADWKRKGGDLAVECVRLLNKVYPGKYILHMLGAMPEQKINDTFIHCYGFINKNEAEGLKKFNKIIANCDLFILPTKAECSAIVYSEAANYGLPVLTYDTGGSGTYVRNEENGYLMPMNSDAQKFAEKIIYIFSNEKVYSELHKGALKLAERELNWDSWGVAVEKLISKISI